MVDITDRGGAVARLTPVLDGSPSEQLHSSGEIDAASADVNDLS